MEYVLHLGGNYLTVVLETWWLPRMFDQGWIPKPLGLPMDVNGMSTTALIIEVTEDTWDAICSRRSINRPILNWQGLDELDRIALPISPFAEAL